MPLQFKNLEKIIPFSFMLTGIAYLANKDPCDQDIKDMRMEYQDKEHAFLEDHIPKKDPIAQFKLWMEEVLKHKDIPEPNSMCLATTTKDGMPSARYMLLKSYGNEGFTFFTNYESRKANELDENPNAAVAVYWHKLNRSIRIEGTVTKMSSEESESYFRRRPRENQISTWSSWQSRPTPDRQSLCKAEHDLIEKFKDEKEIPFPYFWGGYILIPNSVEFWQGQTNRLHDRIRFRRPKPGEVVDGNLLKQGENGWVYERLGP